MMKTLKKAVSLTLMFALVLTSLMTTSVFAATTFSDVAETTQFSEAIYELVDDGVLNGYEDGTFKPEGTITRAEFAKVIGVAIEGTKALWDAKETRFSDMSGHWAIPYVAYASNATIINGYEDGTFRPDQPVTYAEAIKMIVCSLGYGPVVDTKLTPWYQGYIDVANQIGLTKGAATMADNGASRGLVAQLISNRKDCKKLVQTGTDAKGNPTFSKSDDYIINNDKVYEEEGVLVGVYDNTLRGTEITLTKSQVNIDGDTYTLSDDVTNTDDLVNYLGKNVEYTFTYNSNRPIISKIRLAGNNEVVELSVEQIDSISGNTIHYYEDPERDSKTKSIKLEDEIYIVYNGFGVPSTDIDDEFIKEAFDIETGLITFYNNDGDGAMDVAFIEKYKTYFLGSTPSKNNGVYTLNDKNNFEDQIQIDEDDATVYRVTSAGGSPAAGTMTNMTSKSVVSVAVPYGRTAGTTIMVSTATVSGTIASMDDEYEEIEISSKMYKVAPYFRKLLEKDSTTYGFERGTNVKLYLDYLGRIVTSETTVSTDPYGYLLKSAVTDGDAFDGEIGLKILQENGKWEVFHVKDKLRINGTSVEKNDVESALRDSADYINDDKGSDYVENADQAQLIKYKTTTSGGKKIVTEIATVGDNNNGDLILSYQALCQDDDKDTSDENESTKLKYNKGNLTFVDAADKTAFTIDSSTKIFMVPADRDAGETAYKKVSKDYFSDGGMYHVEAYDIPEKGRTAKAVVYYRDSKDNSTINTINASTPTYIILDKGKATYDGAECHKIVYAELGKDSIAEITDAINNKVTSVLEQYTVYTEDMDVLADYEESDIVRFTSTDKVIDQIQKVFSNGKLLLGDGSNYSITYDKIDNYLQYMVGTVYIEEIDGDAGKIYVSPNFAEEGEDGYTFEAGSDTTFEIKNTVKFYGFGDLKGEKVPTDSSAGDINGVMEDETHPETATRVLVIVNKNVVKAVYNLGTSVTE